MSKSLQFALVGFAIGIAITLWQFVEGAIPQNEYAVGWISLLVAGPTVAAYAIGSLYRAP